MSHDNRRNSFRCPVADMPAAKLYVRSGKTTQKVQVNIFDESAGGFGVFIPHEPGFATGETAILAHMGAELICEVTYIKAERQGIHRIGLCIIDEIEEAPEKKNVRATGKTSYFANSSSAAPLICAGVVFLLAFGGFLYYESTKEYRDEFGRKYNGSFKTAFDSIYQTVFGSVKDKR